MNKTKAALARKLQATYDAARQDVPGQNIHNQLPGHTLPPGGNTGQGYTPDPDAITRVSVRKNSTGSVFSRRQLNFIEGSGATITMGDDSGNEEVDITIAASGGGGSLTIDDGSTTVAGVTDLTIVGGTITDDGGGAATLTMTDGGGGMQILSVQADSSASDGGTPVDATLVPDLTLTIAGSATARRALVSFSLAYTATHVNHVNLFLDTAIVFPKTGIASFPGTTDAADSIYALGPSDSSPATYYATLAEYVVTIPGDSAAHDIIVKYAAALSTAATTFYARSLVVKLIADSGDVTL
jgi:hypothetical protein